jgi:hypothetical protein
MVYTITEKNALLACVRRIPQSVAAKGSPRSTSDSRHLTRRQWGPSRGGQASFRRRSFARIRRF